MSTLKICMGAAAASDSDPRGGPRAHPTRPARRPAPHFCVADPTRPPATLLALFVNYHFRKKLESRISRPRVNMQYCKYYIYRYWASSGLISNAVGVSRV